MSSFGMLAAAAFLLAACASRLPAAGQPTAFIPTPPALAPAETALDQQLRESFQARDPSARREATLAATARFLSDRGIRELTDDEAAALFAEIAFSSERLTLSDPVFIRRREHLAVVGLPDGLGLFLFDLTRPTTESPLELSRWTAGLDGVEATWGSGEVGVAYTILGGDSIRRSHFVLAKRQAGWVVSWRSEDQPDWWINILNAELAVAPTLASLTTIGESESTSLAFDEKTGRARRTFRLDWQRIGDGYVPTLPSENFSRRQDWLWAIVMPTSYATLIEFIEKLQAQDVTGAGVLVSNPAVVDNAQAFGLYLIDLPYEVILYETDQIVFRGRQGTFVATFRGPRLAGERWLIIDLAPMGAQP